MGEKLFSANILVGGETKKGNTNYLCLDNSSSHGATEFGNMFLSWTAQPQVSSKLNTKK